MGASPGGARRALANGLHAVTGAFAVVSAADRAVAEVRAAVTQASGAIAEALVAFPDGLAMSHSDPDVAGIRGRGPPRP